ncbi:MAG TPA: transglutaminase-like domain-containing protein [Patescibacteria group bacterium]|nr:transglutaminase-like domain-containing protein [Patescibacteria group bacterium]
MRMIFSPKFFFFSLPTLALLLLGVGCSDVSRSSQESSSVSSGRPVAPPRESLQNLKSQRGSRQILLVGTGCDVSAYTENASKIYQEKDLGSFTVVIAQFDGTEPPKVDSSDACLKMSFPSRDLVSVRKMLALLQEDLQKQLESSGASVSLQNDLPGSCDRVAAIVTKRFPSFAQKAKARCEALKAQQQKEQGSGQDDLQYDSENQQCGVKPDSACSPGMSESQYVAYTMGFVTPSDSAVVGEAKKYATIDDLYTAMQKRPWESDTNLFGCADKFQKPNYYLTTSPTLESNMMCGLAAGDCDDKANAFASLLIASGLFDRSEVRVAMGTVQFGSRPTDIGGHAWTEVYLGDHWIPVDATVGVSCNDNGACTPYQPGFDWDYFNYTTYPVIEYWGWANDQWSYIVSTKQASSGLPAYWKEEAKTAYEAGM